MKNILYIIIMIIISLTSCDENITEVNPEINTTNVNFNIKTISDLGGSKVSKSGEYNRGSAPVYVSGIYIKATYKESTSNIVEGTFDYVEIGDEGSEINMDIPFGSNTFEARSNAKYNSDNAIYLNKIKEHSGKDDKNVYYSEKLIKELPVYAIFNGETTKTITELDKDVNISMTTEHARYSVVLETSDKYDIDMTVVCNEESLKLSKANYSKTSAIVFNNGDLEGAHDVIIKLEIYARGKSELLKTIEVKKNNAYYSTKAGVNNTLVLTYNSDGELYTQETGMNFSWTPMKEEGEVVEVN